MPVSQELSLAPSPERMIHPTADVHPDAEIGRGAKIWHHSVVGPGAVIGDHCILGMGVFVDHDVHVGANSKLQNRAMLYYGVTVEDGVFIGPGACTSNDRHPRAIWPDGRQKRSGEWSCMETRIEYGASIGANATLLPGITVGSFAVVGAGAVVCSSVPPQRMVVGSPARIVGVACPCGRRLPDETARCPGCGHSGALPRRG